MKILRSRESSFALLIEGLCAEIITRFFASINQNALLILMGIFFFQNYGTVRLDVCILRSSFIFCVG